ncbi:hypothetical protein LZ31DRAFT_549714 [Colletotrichum somersetense]|nr:hypothetical protein LZ31DRAFT_549714 [Colletotrichum somersetense]
MHCRSGVKVISDCPYGPARSFLFLFIIILLVFSWASSYDEVKDEGKAVETPSPPSFRPSFSPGEENQ